MIFKNDRYNHTRRLPWATITLSAVCALLAIGIVLAIRARIQKARPEVEPPPETIPAQQIVENSPSKPAQPTAKPALPTLDTATAKPTQKPDTATAAASAQTAETPKRTVPETPIRVAANQPEPSGRPSLADGIPSGGLQAERERLLKALAVAAPADRPGIEAKLGDVNLRLVTTSVPFPTKVEHVVQSGETLGGLASRYVCPRTLIQKINGLKDNNIRAGQMLMILDKPAFAIEISKSRNTLLVTLNGEFFKRYPVCTGEAGKTPTGTFQITEKTDKPTWYPSGKAPIPFGEPGNILGTRWMRLEATGNTARIGGIGIHGTWDDASIGTSASDGCVRMHNADVEELYLMLPLRPHVPVTIVD